MSESYANRFWLPWEMNRKTPRAPLPFQSDDPDELSWTKMFEEIQAHPLTPMGDISAKYGIKSRVASEHFRYWQRWKRFEPIIPVLDPLLARIGIPGNTTDRFRSFRRMAMDEIEEAGYRMTSGLYRILLFLEAFPYGLTRDDLYILVNMAGTHTVYNTIRRQTTMLAGLGLVAQLNGVFIPTLGKIESGYTMTVTAASGRITTLPVPDVAIHAIQYVMRRYRVHEIQVNVSVGKEFYGESKIPR